MKNVKHKSSPELWSEILASIILKKYANGQIVASHIDESNFYLDFDLEEKISGSQLPQILQEMQESAVAFPELDSKAILLENVSGAYYQGNSSNKIVQRISGVALANHLELDKYLAEKELAAQNDHRRLGRELDLFSFPEELGQGLVLYHPKGAIIKSELERFSQQAQLLNGYEWVYSPHIGKAELWQTSGHLQFFKENMYNPIQVDDESYYLKPMSCPFHVLIYQNRPRSYNDLPLRYAEFGSVYRYEFSGALQGLFRARGFTQDDAHIICRPDQVQDEIARVVKFCLYVLQAFGLVRMKAYIATKPEAKAIGSEGDWQMAIKSLEQAAQSAGLEYEYDEGGGAFYGPKIDLKLLDSAGKEWQCSTIQFDFNLPHSFGMHYQDSDGQQKVPLMIHRALYGSFERFIATLLEFYSGNLPLWLSPVQVAVIPVSANQHEYAKKIARKLKIQELRVSLENKNDTLNSRIRQAELAKIPLILVVGEKEVQQNKISLRCRYNKELSGLMDLQEFVDLIKPEIAKGKPQMIFED